MGRPKGSRNKMKVVQAEHTVERSAGYTVPDNQTVYAREPVRQEPVKQDTDEKNESYIERYNRPLPFTMRPAYFSAGY